MYGSFKCSSESPFRVEATAVSHVIWISNVTHTHTHTHTQREREFIHGAYKLPHKTLRVHSAKYTQYIHAGSKKTS